jgi:hypothetical protein
VNIIVLFITIVLVPDSLFAQETCYRGVCFPNGDVSFADEVIRYIPDYNGGCAPTHANFIDPISSLGPPDYEPVSCSSCVGSVSLGNRGLLEVGFVDNLLTNSGDTVNDLHIFEIGPAVEGTFIAVQPADAETENLLIKAGKEDENGDGFYEVGQIGGSTASLDLDAWAEGFDSGELIFNAVQLIDDGAGCGGTVGADIDAVGAIASSNPTPVLSTPWKTIKELYRTSK